MASTNDSDDPSVGGKRPQREIKSSRNVDHKRMEVSQEEEDSSEEEEDSSDSVSNILNSSDSE